MEQEMHQILSNFFQQAHAEAVFLVEYNTSMSELWAT